MILFPMIAAAFAAYWFYRKSTPPLAGWRRILLFSLRCISFFIVLILLFNPILNFLQKKNSFPKIIFMTDISESMNQAGIESNKASTFDKIKKQLKNKYEDINYDLQEFEFAAGLNGSTSSTQLTKTLQDIAKEKDLTNINSLYLISDGWLKDENLDILDEIDFPINVVYPEFQYNDFDLEITNLQYNKSVYQDEISPIQCNVSAINYNGIARVELNMNSQTIASKQLNFKESEFHDVSFEHVFFKSGLMNFKVSIHSDSTGEINTANNAFPAAIQVLENRLKCVIISDKLTWDESHIIDALYTDPHWEAVFALKQNQYKKGFETTNLQNELNKASVLILANHNNLRFSLKDAELISRFVSSGGSVLSYGKLVESISSILPAVPSKLNQKFNSQLSFTETSRKYQSFRFEDLHIANDIPPVDYYYVSSKRQSQILAEFINDQNSPAILFHTYEKGKVIHFAFENLWKWQLRSSGNDYQLFIRNLINWIGRTASDRFIVQTDKNAYFGGETVKFSALAYDEKLIPMTDLNAKLDIFNDDNIEIFSEYLLSGDQRFYLHVPDLSAGKYHYNINDVVSGLTAQGEFLISISNPESRDRGINTALLSYIAQKTGGEIITTASIDQIIIEDAKVISKEIKREIQLYRKWYLIAIFLVSFCTELFFRKRWGML
jgi:hypothetical protein